MSSQKISSQVSTFANEPWRENLLGIDIHQIDQKSRNSGKLIPQSLFFTKREYLKKKFKVQVNGKWFQTKKWTIEKFEKNIKKLRSSRIQLLYRLFVPKIPQNSRKNVSTPETYGVIKYRPHHAVSLL